MPTPPTSFLARPPTPLLQRGRSLARGLTIDLPFGDTGGSRWVNLATPGANGYASGSPTIVGGPYGPATYCTGGSSVLVPDLGNIAAGDFSIRVIHRPRSWSAGDYVTLFDKGGSAATRELSLFIDRNGNIDYQGIGASDTSATAPTAMVAGGLYDFVLTRSGNTCTAYVDGYARGSFTSGGVVAGPYPLSLGGNPSGGGNTYDGEYHLFQAWVGRCLSPSEVSRLAGPDKFALERTAPPRNSNRLVAAAIGTSAVGTGSIIVVGGGVASAVAALPMVSTRFLMMSAASSVSAVVGSAAVGSGGILVAGGGTIGTSAVGTGSITVVGQGTASGQPTTGTAGILVSGQGTTGNAAIGSGTLLMAGGGTAGTGPASGGCTILVSGQGTTGNAAIGSGTLLMAGGGTAGTIGSAAIGTGSIIIVGGGASLSGCEANHGGVLGRPDYSSLNVTVPGRLLTLSADWGDVFGGQPEPFPFDLPPLAGFEFAQCDRGMSPTDPNLPGAAINLFYRESGLLTATRTFRLRSLTDPRNFAVAFIRIKAILMLVDLQTDGATLTLSGPTLRYPIWANSGCPVALGRTAAASFGMAYVLSPSATGIVVAPDDSLTLDPGSAAIPYRLIVLGCDA